MRRTLKQMPSADAARGTVTMLLVIASHTAAFAQQAPPSSRIAELCGSGHQDVIALMLRPDNLTRAFECASGLQSADVDRGEVIARLLDDFGRGPQWAHEEVLSAALGSWQPGEGATGAIQRAAGDPSDSRALTRLADALPHLSAPALRDQALRVLQAARVPALAAIVSAEGERLESQLRDGAAADPAIGRLVVRVAEAAMAASRIGTVPGGETSARAAPTTSSAPLLADVVARLVEVAPDGASVAAARAAATRLLASLTSPIAAAADR